jgi:hypothetical protein
MLAFLSVLQGARLNQKKIIGERKERWSSVERNEMVVCGTGEPGTGFCFSIAPINFGLATLQPCNLAGSQFYDLFQWLA